MVDLVSEAMSDTDSDVATAPPSRRLGGFLTRIYHSFIGSFVGGGGGDGRPLWETAAAASSPSGSRSGGQIGPELALEECEPSPSDDCPICLAPLDANVVQTPCKHKFHAECLGKYFAGAREPGQRCRCPLCRSAVHVPLPVEASSVSGRAIEVTSLPQRGGRCHFDRPYYFLELGSFAEMRGALYVMTSNEDRKTPSRSVMWTLESQSELRVYINFRSEGHVQRGKAETWMHANGWSLDRSIRSPVSSGIPDGPYSGPTYSKVSPPGKTVLYGSECWEGTYFVFVELIGGGGGGGGGGLAHAGSASEVAVAEVADEDAAVE